MQKSMISILLVQWCLFLDLKIHKDFNKIGFELSKDKKAKWLPADFKKNGGYEKSLGIVRAFKMYFQYYCGCQFSIHTAVDEFVE